MACVCDGSHEHGELDMDLRPGRVGFESEELGEYTDEFAAANAAGIAAFRLRRLSEAEALTGRAALPRPAPPELRAFL